MSQAPLNTKSNVFLGHPSSSSYWSALQLTSAVVVRVTFPLYLGVAQIHEKKIHLFWNLNEPESKLTAKLVKNHKQFSCHLVSSDFAIVTTIVELEQL